MQRRQWFKLSAVLLLASFSCFLISKSLLFVGIFFFFPASDLFLTGLAALIAATFYRHRAIAAIAFFFSWVLLGLNRDLPEVLGFRVDKYVEAPAVLISNRLAYRSNAPISISGFVNPIIAGSGRPGDVEPIVTVALTLDRLKDMADAPQSLDVIEVLWHYQVETIGQGGDIPNSNWKRLLNAISSKGRS